MPPSFGKSPILARSPSSPTPAPRSPSLTDNAFRPRDSIVTVSVVDGANSTTPSTSPVVTKAASHPFPFAVAIPALVAGMLAALLGFWLYWYCAKKRRKEKRARYEAARDRRHRKRANTATSRPSVSAGRAVVFPDAKPVISEKEVVPPVPNVPVLAKTYEPSPKAERGYGYNPSTRPHGNNPSAQQHGYDNQQYQAYQAQPTIATYEEEAPLRSADNRLNTEVNDPSPEPSGAYEELPPNSSKPAKASRSKARMAAADNAAASAQSDPLTRYQPKKPSPLALKAAAEKAAREAQMASGHYIEPQETLAPVNSHLKVPSNDFHAASASRQTSGEWGVALGSPMDDGNFEQSGGYVTGSSPERSRYSDDPYLAGGRATSGQYSYDPYSAYHDPRADAGKQGAKRGNWV